MFLTLLTLIAVFLFDCTLGNAFNPQRNNRDIYQKDLRGMQRAKEMLSSNQAIFYTNPRKSETNDSSTFKRLSVPIPNDGQRISNSFLSQQSPWQQLKEISFYFATKTTQKIWLPAFCIPPRVWLTMQPQEICCCYLFETTQQLWYQVFCCLVISNIQKLWHFHLSWLLNFQVSCSFASKTLQQLWWQLLPTFHFSWLLIPQVFCCFATSNLGW